MLGCCPASWILTLATLPLFICLYLFVLLGFRVGFNRFPNVGLLDDFLSELFHFVLGSSFLVLLFCCFVVLLICCFVVLLFCCFAVLLFLPFRLFFFRWFLKLGLELVGCTPVRTNWMVGFGFGIFGLWLIFWLGF